MEKSANVETIGCFETYCSMKRIKEKIAKRKNKKEITGEEMKQIIEQEEQDIKDIIKEFVQNLNIGLTNYINIFEPEAICLGGSFSYFENTLLEKIKAEMKTNNLTFNKQIPEILVAKMRKRCRYNRCNTLKKLISTFYLTYPILIKNISAWKNKNFLQ